MNTVPRLPATLFRLMTLMALLVAHPAAGAAETDCHIIKNIAQAHCARGPERCARCREMSANPKYSLLNICPQTPAARRITEVDLNGRKEWREFDVERTFDSAAEARAYATAHHIRIMDDE